MELLGRDESVIVEKALRCLAHLPIDSANFTIKNVSRQQSQAYNDEAYLYPFWIPACYHDSKQSSLACKYGVR